MTKKQQLISDPRNIGVGTIKKEKNSDQRLGLEGYNRREIFGNVRRNGQVKPQHISSTSNQVINKYRTRGDGNCFFHAAFGSKSSGEYKTNKAQAMRQEWHKFLSQFESLDDSKMPEALKERLSSIFHDVFPETGAKSKFNTSALYKTYLNKISQQGYFIRVEELPILASLADIEINLSIENTDLMVLKPNPKMITGYKRNHGLWGNKERETIYLGGSHYSRAEVVMEDKSIPLLDPKAKQVQDDRELAEKLQQEESDRSLAEKLQGQEYNYLRAQASQEKSDNLLAEQLQKQEYNSLRRDTVKNTFKEDVQGHADKLLTKILQRGGKAEFDRLVKGLVKDFPKHGPSCSVEEVRLTHHQPTHILSM